MLVDTRDMIPQVQLARRLNIHSSAIANWRYRHKRQQQPPCQAWNLK